MHWCNWTGPYGLFYINVYNDNIWPNSARLRDVRLQNLNDLDFDLSMSLKVKFTCAVGLPYTTSY